MYEDDSLLVVNKPKGMVVHPAPGNPDGTMVNALLWHCAGRLSGIGGAIRPGIVHRIDKDTSGLLVVAKTDAAHQALTEQMSVHSIPVSYTHLDVYKRQTFRCAPPMRMCLKAISSPCGALGATVWWQSAAKAARTASLSRFISIEHKT